MYTPLRIKVYYDHSVKNLPEEKFSIINNTILPQALNYWKEALLVKPLGVPIRLNRKCAHNKAFFQNNRGQIQQFCVERCELITTCGEVTVPETHLEVSKVYSLQLSLCFKNNVCFTSMREKIETLSKIPSAKLIKEYILQLILYVFLFFVFIKSLKLFFPKTSFAHLFYLLRSFSLSLSFIFTSHFPVIRYKVFCLVIQSLLSTSASSPLLVCFLKMNGSFDEFAFEDNEIDTLPSATNINKEGSKEGSFDVMMMIRLLLWLNSLRIH